MLCHKTSTSVKRWPPDFLRANQGRAFSVNLSPARLLKSRLPLSLLTFGREKRRRFPKAMGILRPPQAHNGGSRASLPPLETRFRPEVVLMPAHLLRLSMR